MGSSGRHGAVLRLLIEPKTDANVKKEDGEPTLCHIVAALIRKRPKVYFQGYCKVTA